MTPGLIVYPKNKDDISKTIQYANSQKIAVAIRTGGHQYSGASSTTAPNIQLDLSTTFQAPDDRAVFEKDGEAFVRTSVSWPLGEFNSFLGQHNLFVPHGQCTHVHLGVPSPYKSQNGRALGLLTTSNRDMFKPAVMVNSEDLLVFSVTMSSV